MLITQESRPIRRQWPQICNDECISSVLNQQVLKVYEKSANVCNCNWLKLIVNCEIKGLGDSNNHLESYCPTGQ